MDTRLVDVLHDFKIWNPGRHLRCVLFISLSDRSSNSIRTRVRHGLRKELYKESRVEGEQRWQRF